MVPQVLQKIGPGSRSADSRRDGRWGDGNASLQAIKSTRMETLRAKDHSREAVHMMSRSLRDSSLQLYESHWARFVSFCRSKRWNVFWVRSPHFSTYMMMHLFKYGLLPSTIISHCTSVTSVLRSLGLRSGCRPVHQATLQSFPAGKFGATQNYAQVGSSCCTFIFIETAVHIRVQHSRRILGWRHFPKMANHENWIPASVDVCSLETQHQGYHEKSYKPMDPGDSQGSLHTSWSRLWPSYGTWGQSTVCQLHGCTTVALPDILSVAFWRSSGVF